MKEHPILFGTWAIPKILDDTKTVTRRVIKPQPVVGKVDGKWNWRWDYHSSHYIATNQPDLNGLIELLPQYCPYGQAGDGLWVRETHRICCVQSEGTTGIEHRVYYGDGTYKRVTAEQAHSVKNWASNRPSIHMNRWVSRIDLEILSVSVEQLQDITEKDAIAEGVTRPPNYSLTPHYIVWFKYLWDKINAKSGFGWDTNPLVYRINFRRTKL